MSTQVTYKGNAIANFTNDTKTLKTAGKYMEDDVVIIDDISKKYTATITQTGDSSHLYVRYPGQNGTKYYTIGDTFEIHPNDEIFIYASGSRGGGYIYINGELVAGDPDYTRSYTYTVPAMTNIEISFNYSSNGYAYLTGTRSELSITQNGGYDVSEYDYANVNVSSGNNNVVVFTTDDDFESFVCDKSFAQCFNLVDVHLLSAAYIHDTSYGANNVYGLIAGYYSSTEIHYVFGGQHTGKPYGDIVYHSNGTIEFVTPSTAAAVIQPLSITQNGTYTAPTGVDGYSPITVNVPSGGGTYQTKTVSPSTSQQTVTPDSGYDALSSVTVNAMPTGTATAPTSISGTAATVSTGTNTLTLTKTVSVTPRITTSGYISSGTAGNASVSLTANVTTKASATITPGTTNQTIASGTYLTGTQTIAGDADLVGGNILSTANIFGVQGTVVVQNYYTGSSAPSSSTGSNGDLYLQS